MNIDELEASLPNGLHDAFISSYTFVGEQRRVEVELEVDLGDPDAENEDDFDALVDAARKGGAVFGWVVPKAPQGRPRYSSGSQIEHHPGKPCAVAQGSASAPGLMTPRPRKFRPSATPAATCHPAVKPEWDALPPVRLAVHTTPSSPALT